MSFFGLLVIFGCAEPVPLNNGTGSTSNPVSRNAGDPAPRDDGQAIPRNDSGCRVTQFWAPSLTAGKTVMISGTLLNSEEVNVPYLIDVHSLEKNATVFGVECATQKEFSIEIPTDLGKVWLAAFLDLNSDGPSKEDPQGRSAVIDIAGEKISEIEINIRKDAPMEEAFHLDPPNGVPIEGGQDANADDTEEKPPENPATAPEE